MSKLVSLIIVNYKSKNEVRNCLKSIKTKIPYDVIIVDNDKDNVGYGAGVNKGAKRSKSKYLFILNPDTLLEPFVIDKLVNFYQKKKSVGIVGPDLMDKNKDLYEFVGTGDLTPLNAIFALSFINKFVPQNPFSKKYWLKRPKNKIKEVSVAPGGSLFISKDLFDKVGGFDEKFFLYFEESDLCKKVRELGYKIYILQTAKIVHLWGVSTQKNKLKDRYFSQSRFYYFQKNYGLLKALLVEFFVNIKKSYLLFLVILLLAIILRFYRIPQNLDFHGEIGDNYLTIKNTLGQGIIPLLGPPTSHPWLSFGPLFYYLFGPFLILNHYNPVTGAYFFVVVSLIALCANFFLFKKLISVKTALISSYLIAISPSWLDLARQSRFFSMVAYFFYPFLYLLIISLKHPKHLFLLGLVFGIMLNFHLAPIFLIPPALILFWPQRKNIKIKHFFAISLGFLIPNLPFLIYNLKTGFIMLTKFAVWIPYRSVVYTKFNLFFTLTEIYNFFAYSLLPNKNFLGFFIFIAIFAAVYLYRKDKNVQILALFLTFGILALILHKDPPSHYFYVLYPIPVILFVLMLSKLKSNFLVFSILALITIVNFSYLFSRNWFFINQDKVIRNTNIPYKLQLESAKKIVANANGAPFNLKRVGFSDQFAGYFAQNYDYLLWWLGNEPKYYPVDLTYTLVEYPSMQIIKEKK